MEKLVTSESLEQRKYSDVQKLIGRALRYSPEETIEIVEHHRYKYGDTIPTTFILSDIVNENLKDERGIDLEHVSTYLEYAIHDTSKVLELVAIKYPDLTDDKLAEVMSHTDTIDTMALLSLRTNSKMTSYIDNNLWKTGVLTVERDAFIINDDLLIPSYIGGCPAAGSRIQGVNPRPIFKQVIPWAANVHLLSREWQAQKTDNAYAR